MKYKKFVAAEVTRLQGDFKMSLLASAATDSARRCALALMKVV